MNRQSKKFKRRADNSVDPALQQETSKRIAPLPAQRLTPLQKGCKLGFLIGNTVRIPCLGSTQAAPGKQWLSPTALLLPYESWIPVS